MENFNQLIPIDEGKGKKRIMTSLQIAEITGKTHSNVMRPRICQKYVKSETDLCLRRGIFHP